MPKIWKWKFLQHPTLVALIQDLKQGQDKPIYPTQTQCLNIKKRPFLQSKTFSLVNIKETIKELITNFPKNPQKQRYIDLYVAKATQKKKLQTIELLNPATPLTHSLNVLQKQILKCLTPTRPTRKENKSFVYYQLQQQAAVLAYN